MRVIARGDDLCNGARVEISATGSDVPEQQMRQSLHDNLTDIGLPVEAVQWLLSLWDVTQVFDDVADGDPVSRPDLYRCIFAALVALPGNPFFLANAGALLPVVTTALHKWIAANDVEAAGQRGPVSFVWRAGYYDVVMVVVHLCLGFDRASLLAVRVMGLYGEKCVDYVMEAEHA